MKPRFKKLLLVLALLGVFGGVAFSDVIVRGQLIKALLEKLASDPTGAEARLYYNTVSKKIKFYNGTSWFTVTDSGTAGQSTGTHTITTSYKVLDGDGYNTIVVNAVTGPTAASRSGNVVTFSAPHGVLTGTPCLYNGGGTLIGGLVSGTVYYMVFSSTTAASFSDTLAHAIAGTNIVSLSGSATPTSTLTCGAVVELPTDSDNDDRQITVVAGTDFFAINNTPLIVLTESADSSTIGETYLLTSVYLLSYDDRVTLKDNEAGDHWDVVGMGRKPIVARYHGTASTTNTAMAGAGSQEIIDYDAMDFDSHYSVTAGSSWHFTAKRAGKYLVSASYVLVANTGWGIAEYARLEIRKNSTVQLTNYYVNQVACSSPCSFISVPAGPVLIDLAIGDTVDARATQNSGNTINFSTGADDDVISIAEVSSPDVL